MYETRIAIEQAVPATTTEPLDQVHAMLAALTDLTGTHPADNAVGSAEDSASPAPLAARYLAASPIARRRFDAMLREAETTGTAGLRLVTRRNGKSDVATIAAARFLGNSLERTLRQLEDLLPAQVA